MSKLRLSLLVSAALMGSATIATADPILRPHDAAAPGVHRTQVAAHEAPSVGVHHPRPLLAARPVTGLQRVAILDRPLACDSLLCPGYTMMGVGF